MLLTAASSQLVEVGKSNAVLQGCPSEKDVPSKHMALSASRHCLVLEFCSCTLTNFASSKLCIIGCLQHLDQHTF